MDIETRFQVMEARIKALGLLTLSHIVISDVFQTGLEEATVRFAEDQARELAKHGPQLAFAFLDDLLDELRATRPSL